MRLFNKILLSLLLLFFILNSYALAPLTGSDKQSLPDISTEYLIKKLSLMLETDKKPLFIFDVHGTLLKSTWKKEYARLYRDLFHKAPAKSWFKKYVYQKPNEEIMKTLAKQSGKNEDDITKQYIKIRSYFRSGRPLEPIKGGLNFIRALKESGFDIIISSRASKEVITKQLTNAGFLDYLEHDNIVGCPDHLRSTYDRSKVMKKFYKQYPAHQLISFDDWDEGVRTVKELGGITFGLPQGEEGALEINKQRLISEGVDFLLKGYERGSNIINAIITVSDMKRSKLNTAAHFSVKKAS